MSHHARKAQARRKRRDAFLAGAVKKKTVKSYADACDLFWAYVATEFEPDELIDDERTLDTALCDFIVTLFEELPTRGQRQVGINARAGLAARYGIHQNDLALSGRALKAWDRRVPGRSPPPFTFALMLVLAHQMRAQEADQSAGRRIAAGVVLMFGGYLRASELLELRVDELALPGDDRLAGGTGGGLRMDAKTGRHQFVPLTDDVSLTALAWLKKHTAPGERVCPLSYRQLRARFDRACSALDIKTLGFTLHSLRHGGATRDFAEGRSIPKIALRELAV